MLFITNRQPTHNTNCFEFDLTNNAPSNQVYFCERQNKNQYKDVGHYYFMDYLKQSPHKQILFFIHGYNNLPEKSIFKHAESLQQKLGNEVIVVPIIWPCDNDMGQIKDYYDDQQAADDSGTAFARALQKFLAWQSEIDPCGKRMNILAHSMGNRVLRQMLKLWHERYLPAGIPMIFRHIFMVAADVINETLEYDNDGVTICHVAKQVHVFYAADDLALRGSKAANIRNGIASRRLGHTGVENPNKAPKNILQYDCDSYNSDADPLGHTYFLNTSFIEQCLDIINLGLDKKIISNPECIKITSSYQQDS